MTNACTWQPTTVKLYDGREVPSDSEDWRAETEARHVLGWLPHRRREYVELIAKKRGAAAAQNLRGSMGRLMPAYILDLPNRAQRNAYIDQIGMAFGNEAKEVMKAKVLAVWKTRQ